MIERAVFSYVNLAESFENKCGFARYEDFLYTTALAIVMAARHFPQVHFLSTRWGVDVFNQLKLPITEISDQLEAARRANPAFWAYGKLIAYTAQTQPFIHIDNDVFIWKPLPKRILEAELCFQSKEFFHIRGYGWYEVLKPCWRAAPVRPQVIVDNEVTDFAYNCGICGGWNLDFFREWRACSEQYILAPENQGLFTERFRAELVHQNLFHEQYFAASLVKAHQMRDRVEVLADNVDQILPATNDGYTHLWGKTKGDSLIMQRVQKRLNKESPEVYSQVTEFIEKNVKKQKLRTYAAS